MGGMSPFAQALGGLGGAVDGFAKGRQMRDQEQIQQQELQDDKLGNAMNAFKMLAQIGQSDPEALKSPMIAGFASKALAPLGISAGPNGIDPNMFRTPLSALTQNPQLFEQFNQYEPGSIQRQQMLSSLGGTDDEKTQLLKGPRTYTSSEQDSAATTMRYLTTQVANGTIDANSPAFIDQYNSAAKIAGRPEWTAGGVQMGAKTTADINNKNARTQYTNSLTALTNNKNAWYSKLTQAQIDHLKAATGLDYANMAAIPQRLGIAMMNAETAQGRLAVSQQNLAMNVQTFNKLGVTPQGLQAYKGVADSIHGYANNLRVAHDAAVRNANAIIMENQNQVPDQSSPYYQAYTSALQQAKKTNDDLYTANKQLTTFQGGYDNFARKVQQSMGAPKSWSEPKPAKPGAAPTQQPGGKTITTAALKQYAHDNKIPFNQAAKDAQAHGYTIQP